MSDRNYKMTKQNKAEKDKLKQTGPRQRQANVKKK